MSHYTLENDGDRFEREYGSIIKALFPKYEELWDCFITPISCRNGLERNDPRWIQIKRGVDEDLQYMAQSHYTIFMCLSTGHDILTMPIPLINPKSALYGERYDIFYSNLGTTIEMAADVCFFIESLEVKLGLRTKIGSELET